MNWNESVKRILDFIPIFEREIERRESEQSKKKDCICIRRLESFRKSEASQSDKAIKSLEARIAKLEKPTRKGKGNGKS